MKKILLIGHGSFYNRGCEAIVRGTTKIIKRYYPDCIISLCSFKPEYDLAIINEDHIEIDSLYNANLGAPRYSLSWVLQTINRRLFKPGMQFYDFLNINRYKQSDLVISIGGDNFSDDYGGARPHFLSLDNAKKASAKTVIWGASIGPFHNADEEKLWAGKLKNVDLILVREDVSFEYLNSLGVKDNVRRVSDPAFLMSYKVPKQKLKIKQKKQIVGVGMSAMICNYCDAQQYMKSFVEFIDYIHEHYDINVILVPHVIYNHDTNNDLKICSHIKECVRDKNSIQILSESYNAPEMKYYISQCDIFIGARTHSTIASISSGVPTISIGYSIKAKGINNDVFDTDRYVIPIKNISKEILIRKFNNLNEEKEKIKVLLMNRKSVLEEMAWKAGEYLREL